MEAVGFMFSMENVCKTHKNMKTKHKPVPEVSYNQVPEKDPSENRRTSGPGICAINDCEVQIATHKVAKILVIDSVVVNLVMDGK